LIQDDKLDLSRQAIKLGNELTITQFDS